MRQKIRRHREKNRLIEEGLEFDGVGFQGKEE